ncbi:MAG: hypothetical protein QOG67_2248 [Verrucomicrobiota bacterium]|jgi:PAS domain S-box-containing protein
MKAQKILLADRDKELARRVANALTRSGYAVQAIVFTGEEAIKKAHELRPDLVVTDIQLNGKVDGIEAARQIRTRFDVPVIYVTSKADAKTLERVKITSPDGYILKPFQVRQLKAAVEIALHKRNLQRRGRETKPWLAATLQAIGDGIIATDADGHVQIMNQIAELLTGWKLEEALGKHITDVFCVVRVKSRTFSEDFVTRALAKEGATGFGERIVLTSRDGAERPVNASLAVMRNGHVRGVVLVFRDLTAETEAKDALRESDERFRQFANNVDEVFWINDPELRTLIYVNPAYKTVWGRTCESLYKNPRSFLDAIHPDDRSRVLAFFRDRKDRRFSIEYRIVRPDGSIRWISDCGFPIQDNAGKIYCFGGIARDITAGKRTQEELAKQAAELKDAQRLAHIGSWNRDLGTNILVWSDELYQIHGVDPKTFKLTYEALLQCVHPDDRAHFAFLSSEAIEKRRSFTCEHRIVRPDGTVRFIQEFGRVVPGDSGEPVRMFGTAQDVTERREAEDSLRKLSRRLLRAQDEEHRRIARELHDSTAQQLAAVGMDLGQLQKHSEGRLAQDLISDALAIIEQCGADIRTLSYLLHPPLLESLGLETALHQYITGFAKRSGIQVTLEINDVGRLSADIETALFRVAQESLGNVHRHSGNVTATVHLKRQKADVILEVQDRSDEKSRDALAGRGSGVFRLGVGIAGMRERLTELGGRLEIESDEHGTTVRAVVRPDTQAS